MLFCPVCAWKQDKTMYALRVLLYVNWFLPGLRMSRLFASSTLLGHAIIRYCCRQGRRRRRRKDEMPKRTTLTLLSSYGCGCNLLFREEHRRKAAPRQYWQGDWSDSYGGTLSINPEHTQGCDQCWKQPCFSERSGLEMSSQVSCKSCLYWPIYAAISFCIGVNRHIL